MPLDESTINSRKDWGVCADLLELLEGDARIALLTCKPRCWFQSSVTLIIEETLSTVAFGSGDLVLRPQPWEYSCAVWYNMNSETTLQFEVPSDCSGGLWMLFRSVFEAGGQSVSS